MNASQKKKKINSVTQLSPTLDHQFFNRLASIGRLALRHSFQIRPTSQSICLSCRRVLNVSI